MSTEYVYRGLPCINTPWCIAGVDLISASAGVLEWCYDEPDALFVLAKMQKYPHQFIDLEASEYKPHTGLWHVSIQYRPNGQRYVDVEVNPAGLVLDAASARAMAADLLRAAEEVEG